MLSREVLTFAVRACADSHGVTLRGDVLKDMEVDGYRIRLRLPDDPPSVFHAITVPYQEHPEVLINSIDDAIRRLVRDKAIERGTSQAWSPYT
jgi:hypothetical protein